MRTMETNADSSIFIAIAIFESVSESIGYEPLFSEEFFLLTATSIEHAREKAAVLARREETSYQNEYGETINWTLKRIVDVNYLLYDEIEDGITIYSRHFRDYESYCKFEVLINQEKL